MFISSKHGLFEFPFKYFTLWRCWLLTWTSDSLRCKFMRYYVQLLHTQCFTYSGSFHNIICIHVITRLNFEGCEPSRIITLFACYFAFIWWRKKTNSGSTVFGLFSLINLSIYLSGRFCSNYSPKANTL